jgi:hypothetical protein
MKRETKDLRAVKQYVVPLFLIILVYRIGLQNAAEQLIQHEESLI